jgi:Zn-dependent peptidase ImmA (M78 family)
MRRLAQAGFTGDFARRALLPDWWDESCGNEPALLSDLEIRVARFLGLGINAVRDPATALVVPAYPGAQLRRVRDVDRDRLSPAIHTAMQVASALVRTLGAGVPPVHLPPRDGLSWRRQIKNTGSAIKLNDVLDDLWHRGIPVIALDLLPTPSFQGMACIVENRPIILVGFKHDEPGRIAFLVSHEAGHITAGDCTPDHPVVEEEDEFVDDVAIERTAELYATNVLVGGDEIPQVNADNYRDLAKKASQTEKTNGADAGAIIFEWARRTRDYSTATQAAKALYRASGARLLMREHLARHVDMNVAAESDRILLRCVLGGAEHDATAC